MGVKLKTTFGRRMYLLGKKLGLSSTVVENIVKAYIHSLIEDSLNGQDVVIDGFISVRIMEDVNGELIIRGRVSDSLRKKLKVKTEQESKSDAVVD